MHSRKKYAHERIFVLICAQLRSVVRSFAPMASNERIFWVAALFHYADRKGVNPRQSKNSNVNFFFSLFVRFCQVWLGSVLFVVFIGYGQILVGFIGLCRGSSCQGTYIIIELKIFYIDFAVLVHGWWGTRQSVY